MMERKKHCKEIHAWCRNTDAGLTKLNTARNADAELPFFRRSDIQAFSKDLSVS
jgi:hypothetical protein